MKYVMTYKHLLSIFHVGRRAGITDPHAYQSASGETLDALGSYTEFTDIGLRFISSLSRCFVIYSKASKTLESTEYKYESRTMATITIRLCSRHGRTHISPSFISRLRVQGRGQKVVANQIGRTVRPWTFVAQVRVHILLLKSYER